MKKHFILFTALILFAAVSLSAQSSGGVTAMSLSGLTGLYVVPTAHIGWEDADIGINGGIHSNFADDGRYRADIIGQFNISLFKWVELSAAWDRKPDYRGRKNNDDLLFGAKLRLPLKSTNLAFGATLDYTAMGASGDDHLGSQVFGVVTFNSVFFGMPAQTSMLIGKTFIEDVDLNSDIDFGMGFDLVLFPDKLSSFLHWIVDFANFGYSIDNPHYYSSGPWGMSVNRGILNTGLRVDLSQIPALGKLNCSIDAYIADAFDSNNDDFGRTLGLGLTIGASF
jgi:hypothetical protein